MDNHIKQKRIKLEELKSQIEGLQFKVQANVLRAKYAKNISESILIGWETVTMMMKIKMVFAQMQIVQSQPNPRYSKGGVAYCGNKTEE